MTGKDAHLPRHTKHQEASDQVGKPGESAAVNGHQSDGDRCHGRGSDVGDRVSPDLATADGVNVVLLRDQVISSTVVFRLPDTGPLAEKPVRSGTASIKSSAMLF
jgi:hypothetical protein